MRFCPAQAISEAERTIGLVETGHAKGSTVAELGSNNRPLDMIVYKKENKDSDKVLKQFEKVERRGRYKG